MDTEKIVLQGNHESSHESIRQHFLPEFSNVSIGNNRSEKGSEVAKNGESIEEDSRG